MLRYAHVIESEVVNVSVWSQEPTEHERASYAPATLIACTGVSVGPGWRWVEGQWVAKQWVPPEEP